MFLNICANKKNIGFICKYKNEKIKNFYLPGRFVFCKLQNDVPEAHLLEGLNPHTSPLYLPSILTEYLKLGLSKHFYFFHDFSFSKFN